ncbi:alpha/beta fold hydrolase [Knoellia koreensis]|uniref:Alpha/beta hydrolase n=1 Tax=Knoellia koreensis TaxID=2730921 RepID=A0A849HEW0_9MICO|nr:alpha/beta hydrolase [Knoellia sp. DB2414S]NNM44751.1 alpha/beta hydrolase [Knoellia sp. DB2414S]
MTAYSTGAVPVRGGELTFGQWGETGPLVLAVHGITANHLAFAPLGDLLGGDFRVVAPDLRGRGRSRDLPEPYGMASHAADMAALIEAVGGPAQVVVGHSMGGWVATALASARPDVVGRLVLVDGGAPLPLPPDLGADPTDDDIAAAVTATVGPAYERLRQTFPTREAYRDLFRAHPALRDWTPEIEAYVDYDLVGESPELHSACRIEAALGDARDLYAVTPSPSPTAVPSVFLQAERGMLDEPEGMYAVGYPERQLPGTPVEVVRGVNHYTIVMGPTGAEAVAQRVRTGRGTD